LNEDEIYQTKNNNTIYCNNGYGPTFGGGHNFHICNDSNTSNSSYCSWTDTHFDTKGKTNEAITGGYNFTTKEVEVFQVVYTGTLRPLLWTAPKEEKKD